MTNDELKNLINAQEPDFLPKGKKKYRGKETYVCPNTLCRNGSGKDGTGIVLNKKDNHYKCFKCGLHEDVIGLYMKENNTDYISALKYLGNYYGFTSGEGAEPRACKPIQKACYMQEKKTAPKPQKDYSKQYEKWHSRINETDYMQQRGISSELLNKFNIGYDGKNIIIPLDNTVYVKRNTAEGIPSNERYSYSTGSTATLFNTTGLYSADNPIWVVEGAIDALSIMECGAECTAVGLNSTSNIGLLKQQVSKAKPTQPLFIALDNEPEAKAEGEKLAEYLNSKGIQCRYLNPYKALCCKDANECLTKYRELFIDKIKELQEYWKKQFEG